MGISNNEKAASWQVLWLTFCRQPLDVYSLRCQEIQAGIYVFNLEKKKNDIRSIKVQPSQSHLLSGTKGDVGERIHCAFTKVRNEENDVPAADGWMDERMDGCRSGLPVCTCTRQSYLISQPHSSRSQGPGLLMATKNNQSGMRVPMCTTVTRAILKIWAAARKMEVGMKGTVDPPCPPAAGRNFQHQGGTLSNVKTVNGSFSRAWGRVYSQNSQAGGHCRWRGRAVTSVNPSVLCVFCDKKEPTCQSLGGLPGLPGLMPRPRASKRPALGKEQLGHSQRSDLTSFVKANDFLVYRKMFRLD